MDNLDKKNFLEVGDTVMDKFGLAKINKIELNGEPQWVKASFVSGLKSLPIKYTLQ